MVLLIDVSGSMNSPDKLPLVQRSLAMLVDSLKPTDTIGIAVYAGAAGEVLAPTPVKDKEAILRALYSLTPGGSTAGVAGIRVAYDLAARGFRKGGVNRILLATDGDFNVGISDPSELKRFVEQQRERGVMLSVLGYGTGNYRDDIAQVLAQNGNGVAAYIDSISEARKVLVQQAGAQLFTIAKDVKIQVEFNPATVSEYRLVGYETRALAREDFNNDRVDAGDVGAGHSVTAIYEITPVGARGTVDTRRYGVGEKPVPVVARGQTGEYGFLKIRYKLPDSNASQLIEQPIAVTTEVPRNLRQDVRFATAVAGFAQLLQGGHYAGSLTYDEVVREAQDALGSDPQGHRAEFLELVRRAQFTARR
jgi:Ca-activated chloride channel family protein